jgi:hypothetical protein
MFGISVLVALAVVGVSARVWSWAARRRVMMRHHDVLAQELLIEDALCAAKATIRTVISHLPQANQAAALRRDQLTRKFETFDQEWCKHPAMPMLAPSWTALRTIVVDYLPEVIIDLAMACGDRLDHADQAISTYNERVKSFNGLLTRWPERVIARDLGLQRLPLFTQD